MNKTALKNILKKTGKIVGIVLGGIIGFVILFLAIMNIAKFAIYSDYYPIKTNVCKNPGLSDGFACQGVCASEENGKIFVSGYMTDKSASRIYVTDEESNSYYVSVYYENGKAFTGHSGGITACGDSVYISSDNSLLEVPMDSILNAKNGDKVTITKKIPVMTEASFVFSNDEFVYVGEFHNGKKYVTHHPYDTPDGRYYAIVSRYTVESIKSYENGSDEAPAHNKVYSIRNKVQGICFTPDGKVVMSTSYGLTDTVYYIYNEADAIDSGLTYEGAPVYYLCDPVQEIKGPAMGEELEYYKGKIITHTESASNKYFFGKFFFANKIVALDIK